MITYRYSTIIYFTFRTAFSLSFAMKFQRRHWLEDFAWRVERVTQKFRLSRCLFPLCISLLCGIALHHYVYYSISPRLARKYRSNTVLKHRNSSKKLTHYDHDITSTLLHCFFSFTTLKRVNFGKIHKISYSI